MEIIVKAIMGSQLYGLDTPESDIDYKGVYIPDAEDILLNKVPKTSLNDSGTGQDDTEMFTLLGFFKLLSQGQTNAIELLFTPPESIVESSPLWESIQNSREDLIHSNIASFIGYCKQQSKKNSIKYRRIEILKQITTIINGVITKHHQTNELLDAKGLDQLSMPKLGDIIDLLREQNVGDHLDVHLNVENVDTTTEGYSKYFMEVCFQKIHYALSLPLAYKQLKGKLDEYGARANSLTSNADWKALSHAVRVGYEAIELLSTGELKFPLKDREYLLEIKLGKVPFKEVSEEIDKNLEDIKYWEEHTKLPKEIEVNIEALVLKMYQEKVYQASFPLCNVHPV